MKLPLAHALAVLLADLLSGDSDERATYQKLRRLCDGAFQVPDNSPPPRQLAIAVAQIPAREPVATVVQIAATRVESSQREAQRDAALRLFEHWRKATGHERAKADPTRIAKAMARLRDGFSEEELRWAIDGMAGSDFHNGAKDGARHDDMELCFRDIRHVEKFVELARGRAGGVGDARTQHVDARTKLRTDAQKALKDGRTDDFNRLTRQLRDT